MPIAKAISPRASNIFAAYTNCDIIMGHGLAIWLAIPNSATEARRVPMRHRRRPALPRRSRARSIRAGAPVLSTVGAKSIPCIHARGPRDDTGQHAPATWGVGAHRPMRPVSGVTGVTLPANRGPYK